MKRLTNNYTKLNSLERTKYNNARVDQYNEIDEAKLKFLERFMEDTSMTNKVKNMEKIEELEIEEPITLNARNLLDELLIRCRISWSRESKELVIILSTLHLKTLLDCHDNIAKRLKTINYNTTEYPKLFLDNIIDTIRMVGIRKKIGEPLGLTVLQNNNNVIISRILKGGIIEKQELLHVGDVILAVNGVDISKPEELQNEISKSEDHVILKVSNSLPAYFPVSTIARHNENICYTPNVCYMRTLFKYNPEEDTLLPCKEIGLSFDRGEILQIVDQKDPNWWQARKLNTDGQTGLIPSIELEERRKAFVFEKDNIRQISICGAKIAKKKKKIVYQTRTSSNFDKYELLLYEEVTKLPPFKRKTLILIGTQAEQKKILKNTLINHDPDKFGVALTCTSKPISCMNTNCYQFVNRKSMEEDIKNNKYLEYEERNGNLYGIHFDSIRQIILQGKMCIIDCSPISLKTLHNSSEFLPFVIFMYPWNFTEGTSYLNFTGDLMGDTVQLPVDDNGDLIRIYEKYVDLILPLDDWATNFQRIMNALEMQTTEQQWIPTNWIY